MLNSKSFLAVDFGAVDDGEPDEQDAATRTPKAASPAHRRTDVAMPPTLGRFCGVAVRRLLRSCDGHEPTRVTVVGVTQVADYRRGV